MSDTTQARSVPCNTIIFSTVHTTLSPTLVPDLEQWVESRQVCNASNHVNAGKRMGHVAT